MKRISDLNQSLQFLSPQEALLKTLNFGHIIDFSLPSQITSFAWSPESWVPSEINTNMNNLKAGLGIACEDQSIQYVYFSALETHTAALLGHSDLINDLSFVPNTNNVCNFHLASTGNDKRVHLWNLETQTSIQSFPLGCAGLKVQFHENLPNIILVAQQNGSFVLLDVREYSQSTLLLDNSPLLDFDWNPINPSKFGAVFHDKWAIYEWDLRASCPLQTIKETKQMSHQRNIKKFRWAYNSPNLFATAASSPPVITSWNDSGKDATKLVLEEIKNRSGGLSWMKEIACLVHGTTNKLNFSMIN